MSDSFAKQLLAWYDHSGRKDLPWQQGRDAYAIWISEIMLQQTQVTTVIPYYQRFMARFPDVVRLADAGIDEVLHLWSGLGYYARARNLHRAAQRIRDEHCGRFPTEFEQVVALPGIGPSTAGAILAFSTGSRQVILDGNVKRVLCRYHAISGWPGQPAVEKRLWALADQHTPHERVPEYTQAIMDLGATCCTRTRPQCEHCPLHSGCQARQLQRTADFPTPRPRKALPVRTTTMLIIRDDHGHVLLERRPPTGIWGGLWSLPEWPQDDPLEAWCARRYGLTVRQPTPGAVLRHTFSHFHLDIQPLLLQSRSAGHRIMEPGDIVWYNTQQPDARGLAAPVERLLAQLASQIT
ncbi:MAG: A/G-specific adenine glycosylase [Pseudomonadota bacterium]